MNNNLTQEIDTIVSQNKNNEMATPYKIYA